MTDSGLEHLKGLTKLQALSLFDTPVTDAGLERLKELHELRKLNIGGNKGRVTNQGLVHSQRPRQTPRTGRRLHAGHG